MATSQTSNTPRRGPSVGDGSATEAGIPHGGDPAADDPHEHTPGHPNARGTLPMAKHLTDPAIEDEIQALARTAPRMTADQAIRLARLLRWNYRPHSSDRAA